MESEKVKEIKKKVEICNQHNGISCKNCPFYNTKDCFGMLDFDIKTYINELESENTKLKQHKRELQGGKQDLQKTIKDLMGENERLKQSNKNILFVNEQVIKRNEELENKEQLKQFAERLKEKAKNGMVDNGLHKTYGEVISNESIDETLKEFIK